MKAIWTIIIGIFFLVLNVNVRMDQPYPEMMIAEDMGTIFQTNVATNFIGEVVSIDVFSDYIGLFLLFIGSILLIKQSRSFLGAILLIPIAAVIYYILPNVPFQMEGYDLYLRVAGLKFLYTLLVIGIEYFVIHGILHMTDCIQNRWHSNEMMIGWIIAMVSKVLLFFIKFFGMNTFYIIYSVILIGATVFYVNRLFRVLEFKPGQSEEVHEQ